MHGRETMLEFHCTKSVVKSVSSDLTAVQHRYHFRIDGGEEGEGGFMQLTGIHGYVGVRPSSICKIRKRGQREV